MFLLAKMDYFKINYNQTSSVYIYNNEFVAVATCTLADFITLPLMAAQSRLVLQNSSPHFRSIYIYI
jgi:hypothetical protein